VLTLDRGNPKFFCDDIPAFPFLTAAHFVGRAFVRIGIARATADVSSRVRVRGTVLPDGSIEATSIRTQ
jgi:hypothetical protein